MFWHPLSVWLCCLLPVFYLFKPFYLFGTIAFYLFRPTTFYLFGPFAFFLFGSIFGWSTLFCLGLLSFFPLWGLLLFWIVTLFHQRLFTLNMYLYVSVICCLLRSDYLTINMGIKMDSPSEIMHLLIQSIFVAFVLNLINITEGSSPDLRDELTNDSSNNFYV